MSCDREICLQQKFLAIEPLVCNYWQHMKVMNFKNCTIGHRGGLYLHLTILEFGINYYIHA